MMGGATIDEFVKNIYKDDVKEDVLLDQLKDVKENINTIVKVDDDRTSTALIAAIINNKIDLLTALLALDNINVNKGDNDGVTALGLALATYNEDNMPNIVNDILQKPEIDVDLVTYEGVSIISAIPKDNKKLFKQIFDKSKKYNEIYEKFKQTYVYKQTVNKVTFDLPPTEYDISDVAEKLSKMLTHLSINQQTINANADLIKDIRDFGNLQLNTYIMPFFDQNKVTNFVKTYYTYKESDASPLYYADIRLNIAIAMEFIVRYIEKDDDNTYPAVKGDSNDDNDNDVKLKNDLKAIHESYNGVITGLGLGQTGGALSSEKQNANNQLAALLWNIYIHTIQKHVRGHLPEDDKSNTESVASSVSSDASSVSSDASSVSSDAATAKSR